MSPESAHASLLGQLDAITIPQGGMEFQRRLAGELLSAEADTGPDARRRRHLLRLMGDALAWKALSRHMIRELARGRQRPPSLTAQGADFGFVLEVAEQIAHDGVLPIVCDLTHLLGVGDIVAATAGVISIIECKNTPLPAGWNPRGRHLRQLQRQARASGYLAKGHAPAGDQTRISIDVAEPRRCDEELRDCVERARSSERGYAVADLGERDLLVARWDLGLALEDSMHLPDREGWQYPAFGGSATATDNPGPFTANPYDLPLPADARLAVVEGDLLLFRIVDLAPLGWHGQAVGTSVEIYDKGGRPHLCAQHAGRTLQLSDRFIDQILLDFRTVADTQAQIKAMLSAIGELGSLPRPEQKQRAAPEIRTMASFVYRSPDGSADPVMVSELREFTNVGMPIRLEEPPPDQ
jgi:hypothetical protein